MNRLQDQKNGSGSQAFKFLGDEKKGSNSNIEAVDQGFNSAQMQVMEDVEEVRS